MTSTWDEKSVFLAALELPADQRDAYLATACPDAAARERIGALLKHHATVTQAILGAMPSEKSDSQAGTPERIDEFQIIRRLGEGGMGVVYLAEDLILGRRVALKVLAPGLTGSEDALTRFRTEARSTAAIKHPSIVPVFKFGFDGKTHYIACEYVEGPTLAQVIETERGRRSGRTDSSDLRRWYRQAAETLGAIAEALEAAHRHQIIHRDVKPSNILMDSERGPRLTDFGVAKQLGDVGKTNQTTLVGSCHYMSPEQANIAGTAIDQRSDIFSLGIVLYELVVLRRPFTGASQNEILKAVSEQDPMRLRLVDERIPRDLEVICQKALEKRPQDRYQTAGHVAADLRCFLADRPILAAPPSFGRRARHWVHSHQRLALGAAVLTLAVLSLGLVASSVAREKRHWQSVRAAINLTGMEDGVGVYVRAFDAVTYEVSPRDLVPDPVRRPIWLLPGQYRLEFLAADGRFAEVDVFLGTPGQRTNITPEFRRDDQFTASMILVPAGAGEFGHNDQDPSGPARTVVLDAFWIDRYEVTNSQYLEFLRSTERARPVGWGAQWPPAEFGDHPVVGITWDDMQAYARWMGKRLPTVLEWERAARYPDGRRFPWGDELPDGIVSASEKHLNLMKKADWSAGMEVYAELSKQVAQDPNISQLGLCFMLGNAAEMTGTLTTTQGTRAVIVKGGSWMDRPGSYGLTRSDQYPLASASMILGFRCAKSAAPNSHNEGR